MGVHRVAERRSGVDLLYSAGGWAVVYGEQLVGLFQSREEAVRGAAVESDRVLGERAIAGGATDPIKYPRLRSRRHPRHQQQYATSEQE